MNDNSAKDVSLYIVDLDGTLIKSDLLYESFIRLIKKKPYYFFHVILWLIKGKAYCKKKIAEYVDLDISTLPFQKKLIKFLKSKRDSRCKIFLYTGATEKYARQIVDHLGIFDGFLSSCSQVNLTGENKIKHIKEKFKDEPFSYIGDSREDVHIWRCSSGAVLVGAPSSLVKKVSAITSVEKIIKKDKGVLPSLVKAIRPHQWAKNLLIFVPVITSGEFFNLAFLKVAILGVCSYSFCASSVYLLNDLLDLDADRVHHKKKSRPLASGDLPIIMGVIFIPVLLGLSLFIAYSIKVDFLFLVLGYFVFTTLYSFFLKKLLLVDVISLALLFTLRIIAGHVINSIEISHWLLSFSFFIFLSLAFVKRFSELLNLKIKSIDKSGQRTIGRGYLVADLDLVGRLGVSSGIISVLVLSLYISSHKVLLVYSQPFYLWLLCPLIFYWISRVWILTHRGEMNEDPIVFAIKDRVSYFVGLLAFLIVFLSQ